jgi:hypothetical protein
LIPIEIEETYMINSKVLSSWTNHTIWLGNLQSKLRVVGPTNDQCIINSSGIVAMVISETKLDTGKLVVSDFEVMETNITNLLGNGTISSIFPTNKVIEISGNGRVLPEWIGLILGCVIVIVSNSFAWELPWDHVMEDTKSISTAGVSTIVPELTNSFVLWAYIGVCMRSYSVDLKIIPVTITV